MLVDAPRYDYEDNDRQSNKQQYKQVNEDERDAFFSEISNITK